MKLIRFSAAAALLLAPASAGADPTPEEIAWLREHAHPLRTTEPGSDLEDLECLRELIGDARVVGLGEATHGTREHFQLKHRITEFLASEIGFNVFSIEASTPEAYAVDRYVSHGAGDPAELIEGMGFWTWDTEEVLGMVQWMRRFNENNTDNPRSIRFTGFDLQSTESTAVALIETIKPHDRALAEAIGERTEALLAASQASSGSGADWTTANSTVPVEQAAGKTLRLRVDIATRGTTVRANIWMRADADGEPAGFVTTQESPSIGASDWRTHELELDVPDNAGQIFFGLLMGGEGEAYFDNVRIEADGEQIEGLRFDPTFESGVSPSLTFSVRKPYEARVTEERPSEGEKAMLIRRGAEHDDRLEPEEVKELSERFESETRAAIADSDMPESARTWASHLATVLRQGVDLTQSGPGMLSFLARDRAMADNVMWILEQDPKAKVVLWAHNGHMQALGGAMGQHLEEELGDDYIPVGFTASAGRYRAVVPGQGRRSNPLRSAPDDSVEAYFDAADLPMALIDTREAIPGSRDSGWLTESLGHRSIGAMAMDMQFRYGSPAALYEIIVHTRDTSPAIPARDTIDAPPNRTPDPQAE